MKIRIYSPFFPFTMTEGAFQVISDQIFTLKKMGHEIEVVLIKENRSSILQKTKEEFPFKLIFFENNKVCQYYSVSATISTSNFSPPLSTSEQSAGKDRPQSRLKRVILSLFSCLASPELFFYPPQKDLRDKLGPVDLAIYHYSFAYSWLAKRPIPQEARKVVFFHNLESDLFIERACDASRWTHKLILFLNVIKLKLHEKKLSQLCQEIWLISPPDEKQYLKKNPKASTRLVTPTFDQQLLKSRTRSFIQKRAEPTNEPGGRSLTLGYLGGLDFGPNRESAMWILTRLSPELSKRNFNGEILIAGKNPSPEMIQLAQCYPFVKILGFLENTEDFWSSLSYMLVPHLTGSGVRMKLLEALASGVPVLAHPAAVERLHPDLHRHPAILSLESPEDWAQTVVSDQPFRLRSQILEQSTSDLSALNGPDIYQFLAP